MTFFQFGRSHTNSRPDFEYDSYKKYDNPTPKVIQDISRTIAL